MVTLDWIVVGVYIAIIVGMSVYLSLRQKSETDYYLAGRRLGMWPLALSIVATQCSANSLLGAPAFIAMRDGGGLIWLQYELAVPLSAIALLLLAPLFFQRRITTIYEVVEHRFGVSARCTLSGVFLFSRALGTGVTLYATAVVVSACLSWPLATTLLFVGFISILYTTLGGIEADIYSDIIQLVILYLGTIVCIIVVWRLLGGFPTDFSDISPDRLRVVDFQGHGFGDGRKYSFWPMLVGGFFLYVSYYGCDQSQAQRLLAGDGVKTAQKALLLNGLLRFPLVCTYCLFGLLLAVWLARHPQFAEHVRQFAAQAGQENNVNYLVPLFILEYVPAGIRGVIVAGIIAAAMSSLDSAINSLSAATQRDFLERFTRNRIINSEVLRARVITVAWGVICTALAFFFVSGVRTGGAPATVLELVNMVGSAVNGPIMAVFLFALLRRRAASIAIVVALLAGVAVNIVLWRVAPQSVSWFWWNVAGCLVTAAVALIASRRDPQQPPREKLNLGAKPYILAAAFVAILIILLILHKTFTPQA